MALHKEIYERLKKVAKAQQMVTYGEIARLAGLDMGSQADRTELGRILGTISEHEHNNGRPLLSVVAVLSNTGVPSEGFYSLAKELGIYDGDDDLAFFIREITKAYEYWGKIGTVRTKIYGKIRGLSTYYTNNELERLEIHIDKKFADKLPNENNKRIDINLHIGEQSYIAGIRATEGNKYIWISPDLSNEQGQKIKLAEVLRDNGLVKNQTVTLMVNDQEIRILLPSNPVQEIEDYQKSYEKLPETERKAVIQSRIGQGTFRSKLIAYWNGCAVTGCGAIEVLKASHIKPWRDSDNAERLDTYNGLLLIPNLDSAFDNGLISFDSGGRIMVSDLLDREDRERLGIQPEMRIRKLEEDHIQYLDFHKKHIFKQS